MCQPGSRRKSRPTPLVVLDAAASSAIRSIFAWEGAADWAWAVEVRASASSAQLISGGAMPRGFESGGLARLAMAVRMLDEGNDPSVAGIGETIWCSRRPVQPAKRSVA